MNHHDELHVVLGGSGGFGSAVVRELAKKGKQVRVVNRSGSGVGDLGSGIEVIQADITNSRHMVEICQEATVLLLSVLRLFNPMLCELKEVVYEFEQPFVVDHRKYEQAFGSNPTPHREAIRQTIAWSRNH